MSNKTLLIIVLFLVITGVFILFIGKPQTKQITKPTSTTQTIPNIQDQPTTTQPTTAKSEVATITVTSSGFSPSILKVKKGTRIEWLNKSGEYVSVNSDEHPSHLLYPSLNLGKFRNGSAVELVFKKVGTYKYHNHFNPGQTGTVIVE